MKLSIRLSENQSLATRAALLIAVLTVYSSWKWIRPNLSNPLGNNYDLAELTESATRLMDVGRLAKSPDGEACIKPRHNSLQCNLFDPEKNTYTQVRFSVQNGRLLEEHKTDNTWETVRRLSGIAGLEICDAADIASGICNIPNKRISQVITELGMTQGNLFRFRVWAIAPKSVTRDTPLFVQGAFFVRNDTPSGIAYVSGGRGK